MKTQPDITLSTLDPIQSPLLEKHNARLFVKRDDLIHPEVSGNKWRKLKYNLLQCQHQKNEGILTFGGAYSNHLVATAAACKIAGLKSVGVVRGEELNAMSNETLLRCVELGMHLHFVSRAEYLLKEERGYYEELNQVFPNYFIVPEGGANYLGMVGCQEGAQEIRLNFHRVVLAQGTTTTSCGILLGLEDDQRMSVVPVLKGFQALEEMKRLFARTGMNSEHIDGMLSKVDVLDTYHFGGYAKFDSDLVAFVRSFYQTHQMRLDPVYTGKAMFALWDQIASGKYDNETIVFVHTGGLQGIAGIERKMEEKLFK